VRKLHARTDDACLLGKGQFAHTDYLPAVASSPPRPEVLQYREGQILESQHLLAHSNFTQLEDGGG
jgi:hypothetical protein